MLQITHTEASPLEQLLQLEAVQVVVERAPAAVMDISDHNYSVKQSVLDVPVMSL